MIYPSADKIDKEIGSKYALVVLAAKRAKQIKEGARPLIDTRSTNPITVALEEIATGKIKYHFDETSLAGQEALAEAEAVVGYRDLDLDGQGADPLAMPDDHIAMAASQLGADLTAADLDEEEDVTEEEVEEEEETLLVEDDEAEGTEA
jgi:DNA-directed RNA polymerase subunit omega